MLGFIEKNKMEVTCALMLKASIFNVFENVMQVVVHANFF